MPDIARQHSDGMVNLSRTGLDALPVGVVIAALDGTIIYANSAFLTMCGYEEQHVVGRNCRFLQGPSTDGSTTASIHDALSTFSDFRGEILNYRSDGSAFWNEISIAPVRNDEAVVTHFIGTARDVSERIKAEQTIRHSEQRLQLALLGGSLGLWDWQFSNGQLTVNHRWLSMLGLETDGPPPTIETWMSLVHPEDRHKLEKLVQDVIVNPAGTEFETEVRARHRDNHWIWILDKGAVVERSADGLPVRVTGTHLDITDRKSADEKMHSLAYYDTLTGLPNRRLFFDHAALALASAKRTLQMGALLFVDLDNFKRINDARGHSVGDDLLQQIAQRLNPMLRSESTVARLGGDEFVVLVNRLHADIEASALAALAVAERIREALTAPFTIGTLTYSISCSIGITLFPKTDDRVEDLLREADTAMYRAKTSGRNRVAFYETAMHAEVEHRLAMELALKEAIALRQFELYAQPKIDGSHREIGCELLLRWTHPVHGSVSPSQFIPIAEASGHILALGDWVIEMACQTLVKLGNLGHDRTLSVNVSPRQFRHEGFVATVRAALEHYDIRGDALTFEITEGLLVEEWEATAARMTELVKLGIRFSIDDFGTGYSCLAYLKRLPIHELKIDRSFVVDIVNNASDKAIVQSILAVASHLQLHVVAEGVETQAQADCLTGIGCECMQGFLFGRPQPIEIWLASLKGNDRKVLGAS